MWLPNRMSNQYEMSLLSYWINILYAKGFRFLCFVWNISTQNATCFVFNVEYNSGSIYYYLPRPLIFYVPTSKLVIYFIPITNWDTRGNSIFLFRVIYLMTRPTFEHWFPGSQFKVVLLPSISFQITPFSLPRPAV